MNVSEMSPNNVSLAPASVSMLWPARAISLRHCLLAHLGHCMYLLYVKHQPFEEAEGIRIALQDKSSHLQYKDICKHWNWCRLLVFEKISSANGCIWGLLSFTTALSSVHGRKYHKDIWRSLAEGQRSNLLDRISTANWLLTICNYMLSPGSPRIGIFCTKKKW